MKKNHIQHKKMLNVMHVTTSFNYGGLERQVVELSNHIDDAVYNIIICVMGREVNGPLRSFLKKDIQIVQFGEQFKHRYLHVLRMAYLLRKYKIDILHLHTGKYCGRPAARIARTPVVITHEHGKNLWKNEQQIKKDIDADKYTDLTIAVSEDIRQIRIKREKVPPEKIIVIPNGVSIRPAILVEAEKVRTELQLSDGILVLGTVGRLTEAKGYDILLNALKSVKDKRHDFKFMFVGDGKLSEYLISLTSSLGLDDNVKFIGSTSNVSTFLAVMDVFVLSSLREGLPVSMLEAMAAKRPVIATAVGGIPEVISDGHNGILVPSNDPEVLAREILRLINNPELRKDLANNGFRTVQGKYSIQSVTDSIEKLYCQLYPTKRHHIH